MKVIADFWILLAVCFSAGLWLAAPAPVTAQETDCRVFAIQRFECLVAEGQTQEKGSCGCGTCESQGMSSCDDFTYDTCTAWASWRGEYVTFDIYECWGSGSCTCYGSSSS